MAVRQEVEEDTDEDDEEEENADGESVCRSCRRNGDRRLLPEDEAVPPIAIPPFAPDEVNLHSSLPSPVVCDDLPRAYPCHGCGQELVGILSRPLVAAYVTAQLQKIANAIKVSVTITTVIIWTRLAGISSPHQSSNRPVVIVHRRCVRLCVP